MRVHHLTSLRVQKIKIYRKYISIMRCNAKTLAIELIAEHAAILICCRLFGRIRTIDVIKRPRHRMPSPISQWSATDTFTRMNSKPFVQLSHDSSNLFSNMAIAAGSIEPAE